MVGGPRRRLASALAKGVVAALLLLLTLAPASCSSRERQDIRWLAQDEAMTVDVSQGTLLLSNGTQTGLGCVVFDGLVPPGTLVTRGQENIVPSVQDCWDACMASVLCNVFEYCRLQEGCTDRSNNLTLVPYGGCELRHQALSDPETGRPVLVVDGPGFTGGAPIPAGVTAEPIDGYDLLIAQSFYNRLNYPCEGSSIPGICLLVGTPQELAPRCNADPACSMMLWFPFGLDYFGTNQTMFKGGVGNAINFNAANFNQNSMTYVKQTLGQTGPAGQGGGLNSGPLAGIVVVACAVAVAATVGAVLLTRRRRQRMVAAKASAGSGSADAGLELPSEGSSDSPDAAAAAVDMQLFICPGSCTAVGCKQACADGGVCACVKGACGKPNPGCGEFLPDPGRPILDLPLTKIEGLERAVLAWESLSAAAGAGRQLAAPAGQPGESPPCPEGLDCVAHSCRAGTSGSGVKAGDAGGLGQPLERSASVGLSSPSGSVEMLLHLPEDNWQACTVPVEKITFCKNMEGGFVELGTGSFGTVYKALLDGVQPVAAKVIDMGGNQALQQNFLQEATLLRRLRHRNVVTFQGLAIAENRGIILMELMEGRDLYTLLGVRNKNSMERSFSWYNRGRRIALDVSLGIHYIHSLQLTHFDIKSSNVLLSRDFAAKLADVGFTRFMSNTHHSVGEERKGTFDYMAPELLVGVQCTQSVDIYSLGILLWEICSGEHPHRGRNRPLVVPEDCPQEAADLVQACINPDPSARPTAKEVVARLSKLAR